MWTTVATLAWVEFPIRVLFSQFTTYSRAMYRCRGAAMAGLGWVSLAVLHALASRCLVRQFSRMYRSTKPKARSAHCSRQFFIQCHGSRNLWIPNDTRGWPCHSRPNVNEDAKLVPLLRVTWPTERWKKSQYKTRRRAQLGKEAW